MEFIEKNPIASGVCAVVLLLVIYYYLFSSNITLAVISSSNQLHIKSSFNGNPVASVDTKAYLMIKQLLDGTFLCLGTDNHLYTKTTLDALPVGPPADGGNFIDFVQLPDSSLLLIGTGNQLYTKATVNTNFVITASGNAGHRFVKLRKMIDGTLMFIGTNSRLYSLPAIQSTDLHTSPDTLLYYDIIQLQDLTFVGIHLGTGYLYTKTSFDATPVMTEDSKQGARYIEIKQMQDGTFVCRGNSYPCNPACPNPLTVTNNLYTKSSIQALPVLTTESPANTYIGYIQYK